MDIVELKQELNTKTEQRKEIENRLDKNRQLLSELRDSVVEDLENLRLIKSDEIQLEQLLADAETKELDSVISVEVARKIWQKTPEFLSNISNYLSNQVQDIKGLLANGEVDQEWVDQNYARYRKEALKNKTEPISREQFVVIISKIDLKEGDNIVSKVKKYLMT